MNTLIASVSHRGRGLRGGSGLSYGGAIQAEKRRISRGGASNGERGEGAAKGVAASLCLCVQSLGGEGRLLLLPLYNQHSERGSESL